MSVLVREQTESHAALLKRARLAEGLTQRALAAEVGPVTAQCISSYESNRAVPSSTLARRLCARFARSDPTWAERYRLALRREEARRRLAEGIRERLEGLRTKVGARERRFPGGARLDLGEGSVQLFVVEPGIREADLRHELRSATTALVASDGPLGFDPGVSVLSPEDLDAESLSEKLAEARGRSVGGLRSRLRARPEGRAFSAVEARERDDAYRPSSALTDPLGIRRARDWLTELFGAAAAQMGVVLERVRPDRGWREVVGVWAPDHPEARVFDELVGRCFPHSSASCTPRVSLRSSSLARLEPDTATRLGAGGVARISLDTRGQVCSSADRARWQLTFVEPGPGRLEHLVYAVGGVSELERRLLDARPGALAGLVADVADAGSLRAFEDGGSELHAGLALLPGLKAHAQALDWCRGREWGAYSDGLWACRDHGDPLATAEVAVTSLPGLRGRELLLPVELESLEEVPGRGLVLVLGQGAGDPTVELDELLPVRDALWRLYREIARRGGSARRPRDVRSLLASVTRALLSVGADDGWTWPPPQSTASVLERVDAVLSSELPPLGAYVGAGLRDALARVSGMSEWTHVALWELGPGVVMSSPEDAGVETALAPRVQTALRREPWLTELARLLDGGGESGEQLLDVDPMTRRLEPARASRGAEPPELDLPTEAMSAGVSRIVLRRDPLVATVELIDGEGRRLAGYRYRVEPRSVRLRWCLAPEPRRLAGLWGGRTSEFGVSGEPG